MPAPKLNLKDKLRDNELDLSMCDLQEVPVREISLIKKAVILDLSNNQLPILGINFAPSLVHLVKLDLSQNRLKELPENFGELKNLKSLDLYNNKLEHLPLSLGDCKLLRWLDLKNNPLSPAFAEAAGPCIDSKQCQNCAKQIVPFLNSLRDQVAREHERRQAQKKRDKEEAAQQLIMRNNKKKMENKNKEKQKQNVNDEQSDTSESNSSQDLNPKDKTIEEPEKQETRRLKIWNVLLYFVLYLFVLCIYTLICCYFFNEHWWNYAMEWIEENWNDFLDKLPVSVAEFLRSIVYYITAVLYNVHAVLYRFYEPLAKTVWYKDLSRMARRYGHSLRMTHNYYVHLLVQFVKEYIL